VAASCACEAPPTEVGFRESDDPDLEDNSEEDTDELDSEGPVPLACRQSPLLQSLTISWRQSHETAFAAERPASALGKPLQGLEAAGLPLRL
jgi:hypothetical protein